jgi:hypothetical protein
MSPLLLPLPLLSLSTALSRALSLLLLPSPSLAVVQRHWYNEVGQGFVVVLTYFLFRIYHTADGGVTKPSKSDDLILFCSINDNDLITGSKLKLSI